MTAIRALRHEDIVAVIAIAALSLIADALGPDDAEVFNYMNNVAGAGPGVLTQGYLHLLPGLGAAMLATLPFTAQVIGYRLLALIGMLLLYRELRGLFQLRGTDRQPAALALGVVLMLSGLDPQLLATLTWVNWSACLAAVTCLFRTDAANRALSAGAFIGVAAGLLTTPLGLTVVPICAVQARWAEGRRRHLLITLAIIVAAWHAVQLAAADTVAWTFRETVTRLREHAGDAVPIVAVALLTLVALAATSPRQRQPWTIRGDVLRLLLGAASTLGFVLSPRLIAEGFEPRYLLMPVYCAAVGVASRALAARPEVRMRVVGACVALALIWPVQLANSARRGHAMLWLQKHGFLHAAFEFRRQCTGEEVMVFEDETPSLLVVCRPRALAPGIYRIEDFTPWVGGYRPDEPLTQHPYIEVYDDLPATLRRGALRLAGR